MKIVFATSHLTVYGGGGIFVQDYANELSNLGHDISVITQKINTGLYRFNEKVQIIEVGGYLPTNPLHWVQLGYIRKKHQKILKNINPDIVISQNFQSNYFCYSNEPDNAWTHIFYCHEPYRYFYDKVFYSHLPKLERISIWLLRLLFKHLDYKSVVHTDFLVCNSNFTKKRIKKHYDRDAIVFYPIQDMRDENEERINIRDKFNLPKEALIVFTMGLTHHLKGIPELIEIFDLIKRESFEVNLLIGGWLTRENRNIIQSLIEKSSLPRNKIIFTDFIKPNNLKSYYSQSTITIYTSILEAFGQIPIESIRCGTPVIAFKSGGPSETIINNKTGFLIENLNLEEFAAKLILLLNDSELRKKFSRNCLEYSEEKLKFGKAVSKFVDILKNLE
ncbi:MAG: glycosyltransferase [Candidatus Lokiarchaeota archaeon]|nr:glycosyltransferase [Candidatus Lokiarchaeota archaeon]